MTRTFRWWLLGVLVVLGLLGAGLAGYAVRGGGHGGGVRVVLRQAPLVPRPGAVAAPHGQAPGCSPAQIVAVEHGHGSPGVCAPRPAVFALGAPRLLSRGGTGPDLSNNDPLSAWRAVRRHGHEFVYLKVIQGMRFIDRTARAMTAGARAAGITPGGYDFLEVCATSATGEATLFARQLAADGLLGRSFLPMGDAEWPLSVPCPASVARSWLERWQARLHALIGRWAGFYTGAWWANPNIGCWRPPHGAPHWISGYTSRAGLAIPCGWASVDLWQFSDRAFNGVFSADMSVLEAPVSKFTGAPAPSPAQRRAAKLRTLRRLERERVALHGDIDRHHCRSGRPWYGHASPRRYHSLCVRWVARGRKIVPVISGLRRELHLGG